jgi:hypothetical protein
MKLIVNLPCCETSNPKSCYGVIPAQYSSSFESLSEKGKREAIKIARGYSKEDEDFNEVIEGIDVTIEAEICDACGSESVLDEDGEVVRD